MISTFRGVCRECGFDHDAYRAKIFKPIQPAVTDEQMDYAVAEGAVALFESLPDDAVSMLSHEEARILACAVYERMSSALQDKANHEQD